LEAKEQLIRKNKKKREWINMMKTSKGSELGGDWRVERV